MHDKSGKNGNRIAFTKTALERVRAGGQRYYLYDRRTPCLALMVTPTGAKSFYRIGRVRGRPQRIRIGGFPSVSVEQARRKATELNGQIASGDDPQERKRRANSGATLGDLWDHYCKTCLEPHGATASTKEDKRRFDKHLARWRNWRADRIQPDEVAALHIQIGRKRKTEANRVIQLLKRVVNHGRRQFAIEAMNPCDPVRMFKERSRDRFVLPAEMGRLFASLVHEDEDPDVRDFILTALYTGARKSNVLSMAWADIDLDRGIWRIDGDQTKGKEDLLVVLPTVAADLLRQRQRHSEYVFRGPDGRLPGLQKGWPRIRKRAGLPDVHLHDLRRTLASWQVATGASLPIVGKSLGHLSSSSTQVYARLDTEPVRQSVEKATAAMLEAVNGKGADNGNA